MLGFAIIVVLSIGLGLLFGAINVLYRDFENIVDLLLLVVTWTSPVLYTWTHVQAAISDADLPGWLLTVYQLNPVTSAVELFHYGFWYGASDGRLALPPNLLWNGLLSLAIATAILVLGQFTFRRLEGRFAQEL